MNDDRDLDWTYGPDDESAKDPGAQEVFDALKRAGRGPQPPAGFINKLSGELQEVHKMQNESFWFQLRRWLPAAAGAGVVMAAVVAAIFIIPQYLRSTTELEPATDANVVSPADGEQAEAIAGAETVTDDSANDAIEEESLDEEVRVGGSNAAVSGLAVAPPAAESSYYPYPGGSAERPTYELAIGLDSQPGLASNYELTQLPGPGDTEAALVWASNFGVPDARAYTSLDEYDPAVTIIGSDGARMSFFFGDGYSEVYYNNPSAVTTSPGSSLSLIDAEAIARDWWAARGFGIDQYVIDVDPYSLAYPDPTGNVMLRIQPIIEGVKIEGWNVSGDMSLNSQGEVIHARLPGYQLAAVGQQNVISQEEAYEAVINGGRSINYFYEPRAGSQQSPPQPLVFTPQASQYQVGESITLQGWPTILKSTAGKSFYVEFYDYSGTTFLLTGDEVVNFAQNWDYEDISVSGTVTSVGDGNFAVLELASWEPTEDVYGPYIECFVGSTAADGTFESEQGLILQIGQPPEGLPTEEQIEVCGEVGDGDVISWVHISSMPSELYLPDPEQPFIGPVFHTEYGYEQEEFYGEFAEEPVGIEGPFGPEIPYDIGDEVAFTGQLYGTIFESSEGVQRYELYLTGTVDDTPSGAFWGFRLYGDEAMLAEISDYHSGYVRVQGVVSEGEPTSYGHSEPGIAVSSFESFGESLIQPFFGKVEFLELEGQTTVVFIDEATGTQYAIDPAYPAEPEYYPEYTNENFDRIWMALSIHPYWEFAGLQVAQLQDVRFGREVEVLDDPNALLGEYLTEIKTHPDYQEFEGQNFFPFTGNFVIERVELGYTAEPGFANPYYGETFDGEQYATPVWIFYGTDTETGASITIQVDATPEQG